MISINLIKKDDISKREALFAYLNLNTITLVLPHL
jgi:hypothetical protein